MKSELEDTGIISETLMSDGRAWNGDVLPPYPAGAPHLEVKRFVFPPHTVTNRHFHKVINCGYILKGTLTIVNDDGETRDFHAGEALIETVGEIHHGENRGDDDVEIVMFYAGDGFTPISTPV